MNIHEFHQLEARLIKLYNNPDCSKIISEYNNSCDTIPSFTRIDFSIDFLEKMLEPEDLQELIDKMLYHYALELRRKESDLPADVLAELDDKIIQYGTANYEVFKYTEGLEWILNQDNNLTRDLLGIIFQNKLENSILNSPIFSNEKKLSDNLLAIKQILNHMFDFVTDNGSVSFYAWNVEPGKNNKLFDVVKKFAKGEPVGHAALSIELPVNSYTTSLIETYCQKDSKGNEQLIPYLVINKGNEKQLNLFYLIDFSWWPATLKSPHRALRTHDDDRIQENSHNKKKEYIIKYQSKSKIPSPLVLPAIEQLGLPDTIHHEFQELSQEHSVNQMNVLKKWLEANIKSSKKHRDFKKSASKQKLVEVLKAELALVNQVIKNESIYFMRKIVVGLPPDAEMHFSVVARDRPYGFSAEKMLQAARTLVEENAYSPLTNCSDAAYQILKAGVHDDLSSCFKTKVSNLSSAVITPQNLYNMMNKYQHNVTKLYHETTRENAKKNR